MSNISRMKRIRFGFGNICCLGGIGYYHCNHHLCTLRINYDYIHNMDSNSHLISTESQMDIHPAKSVLTGENLRH